jgi:hypothetical protein
MWVRVGTVPSGAASQEPLKRLYLLLRDSGFPSAPLRADTGTGAVFLDVGVEGSPPEPLVRDAIAHAVSQKQNRQT